MNGWQKWGPYVGGLILAIIGWTWGASQAYYDLQAQIASNRQAIEQETKGYQIVVETLVQEFRGDLKELRTQLREINQRLSRMEGRVQ